MSQTINDRPLLLHSHGRHAADIPDDEIWDSLASHGAILFRGFGLDADGFYDVASRFSRGFLVSPFGDRKPASDRNELQTVTVGQAGLSLHFEYGNSPLRPDLLWFYCRKAASEGTGGETLLADGAAIFEKLRPETQEALKARRVRYRNFVPPDAFESILSKNETVGSLVGPDVVGSLSRTQDFRVTEASGNRVVFEFVAPSVRPIGDAGRMRVCQNMFTDAYKKPTDDEADGSFSTLVTWEDGSEIPHEVLDDLKQVARSLTRGIRWQTGDFVLIDNNRMLHGRNQTSDPTRDIVMLSSFSSRFRLDTAPVGAAREGS